MVKVQEQSSGLSMQGQPGFCKQPRLRLWNPHSSSYVIPDLPLLLMALLRAPSCEWDPACSGKVLPFSFLGKVLFPMESEVPLALLPMP